MPIPFRDQDDIDELGGAAFLVLEADHDRAGFRGAFFQITARGEPVEFTYNRVGTPNSFLWRPGDVRHAALKRLVASLLAGCSRVPRLIMGLAEQVPSELFCQDLRVSIPVCRIASGPRTTGFSSLETHETLPRPDSDGDPINLFWFPSAPDDTGAERLLLRTLHARGLLLEPFERATVGLHEVYGGAEAGATRS
jgi:hypothetical protein